jgi:hypothetical protein
MKPLNWPVVLAGAVSLLLAASASAQTPPTNTPRGNALAPGQNNTAPGQNPAGSPGQRQMTPGQTGGTAPPPGQGVVNPGRTQTGTVPGQKK